MVMIYMIAMHCRLQMHTWPSDVEHLCFLQGGGNLSLSPMNILLCVCDSLKRSIILACSMYVNAPDALLQTHFNKQHFSS